MLHLNANRKWWIYILYAFVSVHLILKTAFVSKECDLTEKSICEWYIYPWSRGIVYITSGLLSNWVDNSATPGVCIDKEVYIGTVLCLTIRF